MPGSAVATGGQDEEKSARVRFLLCFVYLVFFLSQLSFFFWRHMCTDGLETLILKRKTSRELFLLANPVHRLLYSGASFFDPDP